MQPSDAATAPACSGAPEPRSNGPTAGAILVYLGFSLQLLQVGIIPLLPLIAEDVRVSTGTISWLVTGSLLSGAIFLAVLTRLADLWGKKLVVLLALGLVCAGSLVGCFADSFGWLLLARILMGAVLPMLALPESLASDTMPPHCAQVTIGAIHAGTGIGISAGLLLGALAGTGHASWRIFFIVGAIASAVGIVATLAGVRGTAEQRRGGFDVTGAALLSLGLVGVLLALSEGPSWGWGSGRLLGAGLGALAILGIWWRQQHRATTPLISVRHLSRPDIRLPYAITFLIAIGIYSALSAVTRLAQTPASAGGYGFSAFEVAWYALPQLLGSLLGLAIIRRYAPRDRLMTALTAGPMLLVVSFLAYGFGAGSAGATLAALLIDSAGLAVTLAMTQIIILRSVTPPESGTALGLAVVLYAVGNSVGSAVVGALFSAFTQSSGVPSLMAYRLSFLVSGVAAALALALCRPLARRRASARAAGPA